MAGPFESVEPRHFGVLFPLDLAAADAAAVAVAVIGPGVDGCGGHGGVISSRFTPSLFAGKGKKVGTPREGGVHGREGFEEE